MEAGWNFRVLAVPLQVIRRKKGFYEPQFETRAAKKDDYERKNEIMMLKYSIDRYQAMGNGPMCQLLNQKMRKLQMKGLACN